MKNAIKPVLFSLAIFLLITACKSQPAAGNGIKIRDIFAGASNVFILRDDDTLWAAGYNRSDQFGLGNTSSDNNSGGTNTGGANTSGAYFVSINDDTGTPFSGVETVSAGENHTVILKNDGTLWGAGDSSRGELGLGIGKYPVFTRLTSKDGPVTGVKAAAVGNNSTFFIGSDNSLWATGFNYYGELGVGNRDTQSNFVNVETAGQNIKAIAAGLRHTVLLKEDGTLWAAGYNFNGQLGLGDTEDRNSFTEVKNAGSGIIAVAAGNYHTVILKNDGSVWTTGSNSLGQLGFAGKGDLSSFTRVSDEKGRPLSAVRMIAARGNLTVLVKSDGSIIMAGDYSDPKEINVPDFSIAVDETKPDTAKSGFVSLVPGGGASSKFAGVQKITLGYNSIYVIASDGSLWVAGSNRYGQLSLGSETQTSAALVPVVLGK